MPNRTTSTLALALVAALALAPGAEAQTETDPEAQAETSADPAPPSTGPKRLKAPEQDEAADAPEADGGSTTVEMLPEAGEAGDAAEGQISQAEPEPEAGTPEAAEADPAGDTAGTEAGEAGAESTVVETEQAGRGPFVGDYTIGDPEAPVQVIEYASFTCPHCAAFHREAWDGLEEDFIEPGRIGFTLREVYFDRFGLWASMAARCGGEAAFYPLAEQYLKHQSEWTKADDIADAIAGIARLAGLADAQLKACLENQEFAQLLVADYQERAAADEVSSTPTFIIRGPDGTETVVGNKPDEVREAIEKALPAG